MLKALGLRSVKVSPLLASAVLFAACAVFGLSSAAHAVGSGENGKIAFTRLIGHKPAVFTVNADGSDEQPLPMVPNAQWMSMPQWSPTDPNKLLVTAGFFDSRQNLDYLHDRLTRIYVYDFAAKTWTLLPGHGDGDRAASWSPDGKRIVMQNNFALFVMDADGQNMKELAQPSDHTELFSFPAWVSDNTIFFTKKWAQNLAKMQIVHRVLAMTDTRFAGTSVPPHTLVELGPDPQHAPSRPSWRNGERGLATMDVPQHFGSRLVSNGFDTRGFRPQLFDKPAPNTGDHEHSPEWSPDGTKIAFVSTSRPGFQPVYDRIMVGDVVRDGDRVVGLKSVVQLTPQAANWSPHSFISWQAIPSQAPGGGNGSGGSSQNQSGANTSSGGGQNGGQNSGGGQNSAPINSASTAAATVKPQALTKPQENPKSANKKATPNKQVALFIKKLRLTAKQFKKNKPATVKFLLTSPAKVELRIIRTGKGFGKNGKLFGVIRKIRGQKGDKNNIVLRNIRLNGKGKRLVPGTYRLIVQPVGQNNKAAKPEVISFTVKA